MGGVNEEAREIVREVSDYYTSPVTGEWIEDTEESTYAKRLVGLLIRASQSTIGEPSDDELLDAYRRGVNEAMEAAHARDGFSSNMSRESIVAGLRAAREAGR